MARFLEEDHHKYQHFPHSHTNINEQHGEKEENLPPLQQGEKPKEVSKEDVKGMVNRRLEEPNLKIETP